MPEATSLADRHDYNAALRALKALSASGVDGILPFDYLFRLCRGLPQDTQTTAEQNTLISYGLLEPDGTAHTSVRLALRTWIRTH